MCAGAKHIYKDTYIRVYMLNLQGCPIYNKSDI